MNGDFSIESGAAAAERLLGRREPPTAIFCFNDEMAMGVDRHGAAARRCACRAICRSSASTTSASRATSIRR